MTTENVDGEVTEQDVNDALAEGIDSVLSGESDDTSMASGEQEGESETDTTGEGDGEGEGTGQGEAGQSASEHEDGAGPESGDGAATGNEGEPQPLDYSMPEDLSERAQDRFTKLVDANKEKDTQIEQMAHTMMGFKKMITDSGLNNDEFLNALDIMALVKSDPSKGIERLHQVIEEVATNAGIPVSGYEYDELRDFPDLKNDVEDMKITKEYALKIAQQRRTQARQEQQDQQNEQQNQQRQQWEDDRKSALPQIGALIDSYQKNDIDWDAKSDLMMEAAKYARDNLPPTQWVPYMKQEYQRITSIATKMAGKRGNGSDTPLMGNNSVRGGQKDPGDIGEWIDQNL